VVAGAIEFGRFRSFRPFDGRLPLGEGELRTHSVANIDKTRDCH
jgi:hypothetical protein